MADDPTGPLRPQETTIYLLGGLNAKMDAVIATQAGYDTRLRTVEAFVAATPRRSPWYSVVAGISGIAALAIAVIALINVVNP